MIRECADVLASLQVSPEERERIQLQSVGQFGNDIYESERKYRLTASLFGRVICRRSYTPCHNLVKSCLVQSCFFSEAVEYGILKEGVAIASFENKTGLSVTPSGLWIDGKQPFLAASPDGLIDDDALVEVKCLFSASTSKAKTLKDVIPKKKNTTCLEIKNGNIQLKRRHAYYYQVQGQLNITGRSKCYFVVYVNDNIDIFYEIITKDENMWTAKMLPVLSKFYKECIAPEIVRGNLKKGLRCVDPPYIMEAINAQKLKLEAKLAEERNKKTRRRTSSKLKV